MAIATGPVQAGSNERSGHRPSSREDAQVNARSWSYTRMTRTANLVRHRIACDLGCQIADGQDPKSWCPMGEHLQGLVAQAAYFVDYWTQQGQPRERRQLQLF